MAQWKWASYWQGLIGLLMLLSAPLLAQEGSSENRAAQFVGSDACVDCHIEEVAAWQGSHHDMAMRHADNASVLGDFNERSMIHQGEENRFFRKGDAYWVNIQGPDGKWLGTT